MTNIIEEYLKDSWPSFGGNANVPYALRVLKLPGQASADSAVNILVFAEGARDPACFIKVNRQANRLERIEMEFNNLKHIQGTLTCDLAGTFPKPLFLGRMGGSTAMIVESFLPGRKIPLNDYRLIEKLFERSFQWLKSFFVATKKGAIEFDASALEKEISAIEKTAAIQPASKEKFAKVLTHAKRFNGTKIPVSSSQGDFDFDNILIDKDALRIADWEDYRDNSHPFLDAEFFIFNLAMYFYNDGSHVQSFERFFKEGSKTIDLVRRSIADYCGFLSLNKNLFYLVSISDTLKIMKDGYGNHKKVPMQDAGFLSCLIDIALLEMD